VLENTKHGENMSNYLNLAVDETTHKIATRIAGLLTVKKNKRITIGEATAEALRAYLKELEENNDGK
jgi:uncharacterized protein YunC (DUF1805 family)